MQDLVKPVAGATPSAGTVAIIEDDPGIRSLVVKLLEREGFDVLAFESSAGLHASGVIDRLDCLILDLMLPGEDGLMICRALREQSPRLPILIVTAKDDPVDRIVGLEMGADDYLAKPFNSRELLARLRSIIRRTRDIAGVKAPGAGENYRFDGWLLRSGSRDLLDPRGRPLELTTSEFDLLYVLVLHPQRVLSREFLIDATRGRGANPIDRVIDVQIGRLRRKLTDQGDADGLAVIRTVRGDGYLFAPAVVRC
ncbi:response regulator [Novosphingobium guangzhouense]|uniref:Regulatory protein VirG n=1 Tax=Novosphingobium guangzhouense TaxID=1850347 RepID=A0A2K2G3L0_9SPHN|nr:response regulator [Novosphingobium guangzhouense]PNU05592.1 DNA-binding response regulator [Novosphingobium guangzhouense]